MNKNLKSAILGLTVVGTTIFSTIGGFANERTIVETIAQPFSSAFGIVGTVIGDAISTVEVEEKGIDSIVNTFKLMAIQQATFANTIDGFNNQIRTITSKEDLTSEDIKQLRVISNKITQANIQLSNYFKALSTEMAQPVNNK